MPNGIRVKQYRPFGAIKVVRSADSSSNPIVWKASDSYNGEHFSVLQERELLLDRRDDVHGFADCFIYRLARIYTYILSFSLDFSFINIFDNHSVCHVTGLIVPFSQSLDRSSLTLSSLDTGMRRLGAWISVTLGSISM